LVRFFLIYFFLPYRPTSINLIESCYHSLALTHAPLYLTSPPPQHPFTSTHIKSPPRTTRAATSADSPCTPCPPRATPLTTVVSHEKVDCIEPSPARVDASQAKSLGAGPLNRFRNSTSNSTSSHTYTEKINISVDAHYSPPSTPHPPSTHTHTHHMQNRPPPHTNWCGDGVTPIHNLHQLYTDLHPPSCIT